MNLLEVMQGAADKFKKVGSSIFNEELFKGNMSGGSQMPPIQAPPIPTADAAQMMQADIARSGIENEAVGYLQPAPPMPVAEIPQLYSYREPLPQTQPQPPQETERERILRENMERIRRGEPPPMR
jgi:hypothetical protein